MERDERKAKLACRDYSIIDYIVNHAKFILHKILKTRVKNPAFLILSFIVNFLYFIFVMPFDFIHDWS